MRVMGSQCISTRPVLFPCVAVAIVSPFGVRRALLLPGLLMTGGQLGPPVAPLRFFVESPFGDATQAADQPAVGSARRRRDLAPRRLVHEGHELVGKARHGAADADAAHVRAAADTVDPTALGNVALDDRTPAAELHDALGGAVLVREI